MPGLAPCLWFDREAEAAADFYCAVFPNSKVTEVARYPEGFPGDRAGQVLTVAFELDGKPFTGLNGGPDFTFSEAISFQIDVETQAELDRYWNALLAGGGQESMCGWLKDRFGVSWRGRADATGETDGQPGPGGRRPGGARDDADGEAGHRQAGSGGGGLGRKPLAPRRPERHPGVRCASSFSCLA